MTTTTAGETGRKLPWHFWAAGLVGLFWNGFGAFDYTMTQLKGDAWLRQAGMNEPQITYFHAMPVWMTGVWAVGVWSAVLGTVLLLARSRWAFHVFVVSLAAYLLSLVYYYLLSDGLAVMGAVMIPKNLAILAGCVFYVWYANRMTKPGVLR